MRGGKLSAGNGRQRGRQEGAGVAASALEKCAEQLPLHRWSAGALRRLQKLLDCRVRTAIRYSLNGKARFAHQGNPFCEMGLLNVEVVSVAQLDEFQQLLGAAEREGVPQMVVNRLRERVARELQRK